MSEKKSSIITIPNIMSFFRLCLIPYIMYFYKEDQVLVSAILCVVSGITDVADGYIARHFDMVSDLGKVLDPFADKMTQASLILCLVDRYPVMRTFIVMFIAKEAIQFAVMYRVAKKNGAFPSSKWYGKACTASLYTVCIILILVPDIDPLLVTVLSGICAAFLLIALVGYTKTAIKAARNEKWDS